MTRHTRLFSLAFVLLILLAYGSSLGNAFVYDDALVIEHNAFIRVLSHIKDVFRPAYFAASGELSYRPVVTLSYFFDHALFGLRAWAFHLHGLILHAGVALSLLWLLRVLGVTGWPAWLATVVFAVHPAGVESVACPANREELYCAMFLNLSAGLWLQGKRRRWPAACLFFALALFSKETAVMLPVFLIGAVWLGRRRVSWAGIAGMAVTLGLYGIVRFALLRNPLEAMMEYRGGNFLSSLVAHAQGWPLMLRLFVSPTDLSVDHVFAQAPAVLAVPVLLVAAALLLARWNLCAGLGLFWVFCFFVPVSGVMPIANAFAERFLYVPLEGFALLIAGLGQMVKARAARISAALMLLCIGLLAALTAQRVAVWKNGETLWADAIVQSGNQPRAHNNFGVVLMRQGAADAARLEFETAIRLDPGFSNPWTNFADYHEQKGDLINAEICLQNALTINPKDPYIRISYGDVLYKMNRYAQAEEQYREALRLKPGFAEARNNLGILLLNSGRVSDAREQLAMALREVPDYPDALCNMGTLLAESGDMAGAQKLWKKTLHLNPFHEGARINLQKIQ